MMDGNDGREIDPHQKLTSTIVVVAEDALISTLISNEMMSGDLDVIGLSAERLERGEFKVPSGAIWIADCTSNDEANIKRYGGLAVELSIRMLALIGRHQLSDLNRFYAYGLFGILPSWYSKHSRLCVIQLALDGQSIAPSALSDSPKIIWGRRKTLGSRHVTVREFKTLSLVAAGFTNRAIAEQLEVAEPTVKMHVTSLCRKLNADNRTHLVSIALRTGLISFESLAQCPSQID